MNCLMQLLYISCQSKFILKSIYWFLSWFGKRTNKIPFYTYLLHCYLRLKSSCRRFILCLKWIYYIWNRDSIVFISKSKFQWAVLLFLLKLTSSIILLGMSLLYFQLYWYLVPYGLFNIFLIILNLFTDNILTFLH